jgi:hypothetical protein
MAEERSLPDAWYAAIRWCPYCGATGKETAEQECLHCDGSGDLFGAMLAEAYRLGREEALLYLRNLAHFSAAAREHAENAQTSVERLKFAVGAAPLVPR